MKTIIINENALDKIKKVNSGLRYYENDKFAIGFEPGGNSYGHVIEDVDPEDVDLSSFQLKNKLNPKFWKNNLLDSRVRLKLLDIADDFIDFLGIDWVKPEDILMTGSLANYNWSEKYSDIDLHIVMDYSKIDEKEKFVERFLRAQTVLWSKDHEELNICGFPVEIYVQDTKDNLKSGGIYSLDKNKWIKEPQKEDLTDENINKRWVQRRVASYMDKIESLEKRLENAKDDFQIERVSQSLDKIFDKIKEDRADGFKKGGEMNDKNIVFKSLRRQGYLGKIKNMQKKIYNKLNSI